MRRLFVLLFAMAVMAFLALTGCRGSNAVGTPESPSPESISPTMAEPTIDEPMIETAMGT